MEDLKRILVVSMSTKHCLKAVQWGISLAKTYKAKLYVVHIIHNPFGLEGWNLPISSLKALEEDITKMKLKAKQTLEQYIESEDRDDLTIEQLVIEGDPKGEIPKLIEKEQIDLVVMVAHEQDRLEHLIYGREIHDLVRKMPCSLFLVRRELEYSHPRL